MRRLRLLRRQHALLNCAPISHDRLADRSMRAAVSRADDSDEFLNQQSFDRAVAEIVRLIPIPPETTEWFSEKDLAVGSKWTWKRMARNPAVLAISVAVVVIAGVSVFQVLSRLNDFPGSATARKLLTVAASTRPVMLDPVSAEAGTLSDLFFMKHGLEHYDVPDEFANFQTIGCRVFEDEESRRIAQIWLAEKRIQLFLFPAERNAKTGAVLRFPDGATFIRKLGSALSLNAAECASWPRSVAEKKISPRICRRRNRSAPLSRRLSCRAGASPARFGMASWQAKRLPYNGTEQDRSDALR